MHMKCIYFDIEIFFFLHLICSEHNVLGFNIWNILNKVHSKLANAHEMHLHWH